MGKLKINEMFYSIQGEGVRAGLPCFFIRLHGCGLRCSYCDTTYSIDHKVGGEYLNFEEIKNQVYKSSAKFVEFTGGEPLEQPSVHLLIKDLLDEGFEVAVETAGHIDISTCDPRLIIIMDVKTPSSLMSKKNNYDNFQHLKKKDEIKFVCGSLDDYEFSKKIIEENKLIEKVNAVLISPIFDKIKPIELVEQILKDKLQVRFQLQLHKFIWDPNERGV